jgi:hypothetical protein
VEPFFGGHFLLTPLYKSRGIGAFDHSMLVTITPWYGARKLEDDEPLLLSNDGERLHIPIHGILF